MFSVNLSKPIHFSCFCGKKKWTQYFYYNFENFNDLDTLMGCQRPTVPSPSMFLLKNKLPPEGLLTFHTWFHETFNFKLWDGPRGRTSAPIGNWKFRMQEESKARNLTCVLHSYAHPQHLPHCGPGDPPPPQLPLNLPCWQECSLRSHCQCPWLLCFLWKVFSVLLSALTFDPHSKMEHKKVRNNGDFLSRFRLAWGVD